MRASPLQHDTRDRRQAGPRLTGAWNDPFQIAVMATSRVAEIHIRARPLAPGGGIRHEAVSAYARLLEALSDVGAAPSDVITEKIFLADMRGDAAEVARVREEFYRADGSRRARSPATSFVQQPPLGTPSLCEIQAFVLLTPEFQPLTSWNLRGLPDGVSARAVDESGPIFLYVHSITGGRPGDGAPALEQAAEAYRTAESILIREGFDFRDVFRTWLYLAEIDEEYASLNVARREFYALHRVDPPPASTGIGGLPHPGDRRVGLDLGAAVGLRPGSVRPIHAHTLNEAPSYGSDFARGTRLDLGDRCLIHLSGTASIDESGEIVHPGSIERQAERMLVNVEALLAGQGAGYGNLVSLVTYLKRPEFVEPFRRVAAARGLPPGVPHTICHADICRPGWLCEMEGLAILGS